MKNFLRFVLIIILCAVVSLVISLVFGLMQWITSLILGLVPVPTWHKLLWGALGIFLLAVGYAAFKVLQTLYHAWRDPVFGACAKNLGLNWDQYKSMMRSEPPKDDYDDEDSRRDSMYKTMHNNN